MQNSLLYTARRDVHSDAETGESKALVPWWSFTKTILATAALRLVACGDVDLDAALHDRPYTLRQLLQHRAGVPNYGQLRAYHQAVERGDTPWNTERLFREVNIEQLDFEPGHGWAYSNVGYLLVARLIEELTGQDLASALKDLIFDVVGLESVYLATTIDDLHHSVWGNRRQYDPKWVYHGLLVGAPSDAVRFLHTLVTGRLLPNTLLRYMTAPHPLGGPLPGRPWQTTGYGLGLMIGEMAGVGLAIGHTGGGPGSTCAVYHFGANASPCTVAAFCCGDVHDAAEHEVVRLVRMAWQPPQSQPVQPPVRMNRDQSCTKAEAYALARHSPQDG